MNMHFATIWEGIADAIGDREALVHGDVRRTWSEFDNRAARLASALAEAGLKPNSKVGLYLYNGNEYLESQYASLKNRYVPVNINYRYLDDELLYLLENSDAEALVFHTSLSDRVERIREHTKGVRLWVEVDDGGDSIGAVNYETLLSQSEPAARINRSEEDIYMLYTGGTTGMPKGVMYHLKDMTGALLAFGYPITLDAEAPPLDEIPAFIRKVCEEDRQVTSIPGCPLMHGTGLWLGAMAPHLAGARVVCLHSRSFVASEIWETAERERANMLVIVGDAFAKPMLTALDEAKAEGRTYDMSSIQLLVSSGVMWTQEVKEALLKWHPFTIVDTMGSTEGGMATSITTRDSVSETAQFAINPTTKVFTEDGREVEPGSGEIGLVASGGSVPIGYYKDEAKSRATFKEIDGVRYSFPGDWASVEADGTLRLLGRGSNCINTAGEKVYPEEVEEAVKQHPQVLDCLVVGVDDERFVQRVTGVVSLLPGESVDGETLKAFVRKSIAAYKVPKDLFIVEQVQRAPNGKADYKWAKQQVLQQLA